MPGPVFLSGERVTLRPAGGSDLDFLNRNHSDPAVRRSMPRVRPHRREETRAEYEHVHVLVSDSMREHYRCTLTHTGGCKYVKTRIENPGEQGLCPQMAETGG